MPKEWYDRHAANLIEDEGTRKFYRDIVADKKPYFMRYIYPDLMRQYNTYKNNANRNSLREFQMTIEEMSAIPYNELTERQRDFLYYYNVRMPVGVGDCVMNKICRRFEEEFDGYVGKYTDKSEFDYTILKSGVKCDKNHYYALLKLYEEYTKRLQNYMVFAHYDHISKEEVGVATGGLYDEFMRDCNTVCQNEFELCDIFLDICYKKSFTKKFVWGMCGSTIISNLLANNGNTILYPTLCASGEIDYCGQRFTVAAKQIGGIQ